MQLLKDWKRKLDLFIEDHRRCAITIGILVVVLLLSFVTGCASTGMSEKGEVQYYKAQQAAAEQPCFDMSCPADGCTVQSLKVYSCDSQHMTAAPVQTPVSDTATALGKAALGSWSDVATFSVIGDLIDQGFDAAQGDTYTETHESTETTETHERGDTFGDGAHTVGRDQIGDNSGPNSGNSGRIESDGDFEESPTGDNNQNPDNSDNSTTDNSSSGG